MPLPAMKTTNSCFQHQAHEDLPEEGSANGRSMTLCHAIGRDKSEACPKATRKAETKQRRV